MRLLNAGIDWYLARTPPHHPADNDENEDDGGCRNDLRQHRREHRQHEGAADDPEHEALDHLGGLPFEQLVHRRAEKNISRRTLSRVGLYKRFVPVFEFVQRTADLLEPLVPGLQPLVRPFCVLQDV